MTTSAKTFTPFVFLRRGRVWTIVFPGPGGTKKQKALPFRGDNPAHEAKARKALAQFIERTKATKVIEGDGEDGPMTVERWSRDWLRTRETKGISTVGDYRTRLRLHILPHIGHLRLDKVTPDRIVDVMHVASQAGLAPRTQRHVYATMVTMFNRAVPRLLAVNPCSIHTDDLPGKQDADPEWRPTAIFSREEVVTILTSPIIPPDRRVIYAVMFLAGMRFGEISALYVRHYVPHLEPLGQLQVGRSYNSDRRVLKGVKTDRPRLVPVHPWLAQILDRWLAVGWAELMGRPPGPDDILIPTRLGTHRGRNNGWKQMNGVKAKKNRPAVLGDLARVGLRNRRQHDARRTFITLARADGARKDLLRLVSHGPEGDIVDVYTEMPWAPLCAEVAKLKLSAPRPAPLGAVPNSATSLELGCHPGCQSEKLEGIQEVVMVTPPGIETARSHGTGNANGGQGEKVAPLLASLGVDSPAGTADDGQDRPTATMATLALRQALAALKRGRVDQATEIIERAVADEATAARRRVDGRRS